ncbi:hypothetical protein PILCRDRAFT_72270 [Piloderma croceum F 1598]|uniref:PAS domain-containing protein n=1 Tax=Piloderma croceum (strain F 1598) TaxID=765440 RepID=A0A0C3F8B2_PILCF|nr:hypothetical protein PILCRDRAFT_72270 [Piloderma croceum F 1598]
MNRSIPCLSFIGIVDFSGDAHWMFLTNSVSDLLVGFEPHELVGRSAFELTHPDEFNQVKQLHYNIIKQDKAAVLSYLRIRHKDPYKGYILCAVSQTVVHNVIIGSISLASSGAKAMHNASTAQEIQVITPYARDFEFRRWSDPPPMAIQLNQFSTPPSSSSGSFTPFPLSTTSSTSTQDLQTQNIYDMSISPCGLVRSSAKSFDPQSIRVALILDRFTINCTIIYCSNDNLLSTTDVMGRSLYDFVSEGNVELVRTWVDMVKGWGVNERGQPSDGGFGFGRFTLCPKGRDSSELKDDGFASRRRGGTGVKATSRGQMSHTRAPQSASSAHPRLRAHVRGSLPLNEEIKVDAIFSAHSDGVIVILRRAV